jgi:hypothetical protein
MRVAPSIVLTDSERTALPSLSRSGLTRVRLALRAQIILRGVRIRHSRQLIPLHIVQFNRTCFAQHSLQNLSISFESQIAIISSINNEALRYLFFRCTVLYVTVRNSSIV